MPRLSFRPKLFNGLFLTGFTLFFVAWGIIALDSFWVAAPLLVPLIPFAFLCLAIFLNACQQKIELNDNCINFGDGQTNDSVFYNSIKQICVSRGEAFDGQPQIYLRLITCDNEKHTSWNVSDFGLCLSLHMALALAKRVEIDSVVVTLHGAREKELRKMTRKLGTLTLLPQQEPEIGKSKNWFVTFLLEPHR